MSGDYLKFFKYFHFLMIYFVVFYLFYKKNLELVGIFIGSVLSLISNLFLFIDIISSPKSSDPVVFVFFIGIVGMFVSTVLLLFTMVRLHSLYNSQESPIQFTKEGRKILDRYKQLFIADVLAIFSMAFLYFTTYKIDLANVDNMGYLLKNNFEKSGDYYVPFFNSTFDPNGNTIVESFMLLLKGVLSIVVCGSTGLMLYYTTELEKLRPSQVYVTEEQYNPPPTKLKRKGTNISYSFSRLFENLNMNYLLHSTTII